MNHIAELTGLRQFTLTDREIPDPGPGEVQVRVAAIGICGSDMHGYSEGAVGDMALRYPIVLGHEPSGTVIKTGAGVTGWAAGDLAALEPAIYCYHCEFCMSGRHNVCANMRFMSSGTEPGFFREFANLPARNLVALKKGMSLREGTLVEPLAIALHSLEFAPPRFGMDALVIGAGPIGLLTVAALRLGGARRIFVAEPLAYRREMAIALGADVAVDPEHAEAEVLSGTDKRGVDAVFDCAAKVKGIDTVDLAIRAARSYGRVVMTGIHSETDVPINVQIIRRKELALFGVRRSNHESETALSLLAAHPKLFAPVITHERGLDRINQAFALNESYSDGVGKLLIVPGLI